MKTIFVDLDGTIFTLKNFFRTNNFYSSDSDLLCLLKKIPANIVYVTSRSMQQVHDTKNIEIISSKVLCTDKVKNIRDYVRDNNVSEYVLIDDDKNLKYMFPGHTVIIDWFNGFTLRDYFDVLRILKFKLKFNTDKGNFYLDVNNVDVSFEKIKALLKSKYNTPNLEILEAIIYES